MRQPYKISLAAFFLATTVFSLAACGHRHYDQEHRSQWLMNRIAQKLDLNQLQKAKLEAINTQIQTGLKNHQDRQRQLLDRLIKDVQEPSMNKQLLLEVVQSRQQAYSDIAPGVVDKIIDFYEDFMKINPL